MKASEIMTSDVLSVAPEAKVSDATQIMLEHQISGLPVVSPSGYIHGIVTEGDLLRRAELQTQKHRPRWLSFLLDPETLAKEYAHASGRTVADVMTQAVVTVSEDTPLEQIVKVMQDYHIKRLPVQRDGRMVGIISRADIVRALNANLTKTDNGQSSDKVIRRRLGRALHEFSWRHHRPRFEVRDGVVDIFWIGESYDWERQALRVAAENIAGVREIREHILRD